MLAFFCILAVVTAGAMWATETVDRPRRALAKRERLATLTQR